MVGIPIGITSSAIGLNICAVTAAIKKYKSMIKKKKKKHDKIVFLAKSKLNSIEVLISKALINSFNSLDEFVLINVLKSITKWKKKSKIERLNQFIQDFSLFIKQCYCIVVWNVEEIQKVKIQKLQGQKMEEWCFYKIV